MKIAVTYDNGEIFQHFGHTEQFKLYDVEDGKIINEQIVDTNETLIIPLYGRKLCAEHFPALYQDEYAARICDSIDYDFSQFKDKEKSAMYQFGALEGAMREKDMLWEITDYLKEHPNAAVVNLGCGLNMTGRTADNGTCRIYNLDFPDVIKSRNELVPAGDREENIACDLNDFSWMDQIDASEGAVLYAAGVFHYFTTQQIKDTVNMCLFINPIVPRHVETVVLMSKMKE